MIRRTMTDMMLARKSLQLAIDRKDVILMDCEMHTDIKVIADNPARGVARISYANEQDGKILAISVVVTTEPFQGLPCFQLGYAVSESARQQGLATDIVPKAIDEFTNGMKRNGISKFYIEAIVGTSNTASNKIARRFISDTPMEGSVDDLSGEPIFQYMKLIET